MRKMVQVSRFRSRNIQCINHRNVEKLRDIVRHNTSRLPFDFHIGSCKNCWQVLKKKKTYTVFKF